MRRKFLFLCALFSLFALTACHKNKEPLEPFVVEMSKTTFVEGGYIENDVFTVKVLNEEGKEYQVVTDFTTDLEGIALDATVENVTVTYGEYTKTLDITVLLAKDARTDIELQYSSDLVFTRGANMAEKILYRDIYSDGTAGEWFRAREDYLTFTPVGETCNVVFEIRLNNKTYKKEFTIPFVETDTISVKEFKEGTVDQEYTIKGIIASFLYVSPNEEAGLLIWDKENDEFIDINGVGKGSFAAGTADYQNLEVGDEVLLQCKLVKSDVTQYGDPNSGRIYGKYSGGENYDSLVISKNNKVTPNKENAILVSTENELKALFDGESLENFHYQLVRLHGYVGLVHYENSSGAFYERFFLNDVANYDEQRVTGNVSPVFSVQATQKSYGTNPNGLITGYETTSTKYQGSDAAGAMADVYCVFVGGNTYYASFQLLGLSYVDELEVLEVGRYIVEPTKVIYSTNEELDLTGCQIIIDKDYDEDVIVPVTAEMITETPDMTSAGTKTVKVTYDGQEYEFTINVVNGLDRVEIVKPILESMKVGLTLADVAAKFEEGALKLVKTLGEPEFVDVEARMLSMAGEKTALVLGDNTITLTYLDKTIDFVITAEIAGKSVTEAFELEKNTEDYFSGVLIGLTYYGNASQSATDAELLIKDPATQKFIGVRGLSAEVPNLAIGDILAFYGKVVHDTAGVGSANYGKIYINYDAKAADPAKKYYVIADHTDDASKIQLDLSNCEVLVDEADIQRVYRGSARADSVYKIYKFIGDLRGTKPYENMYRIFYKDATDNPSQYVDSTLSPVMKINANLWNGGLDINELFGGATSYGSAQPCGKSLYMACVGGTGAYYLDFVILGAYCVVDDTPFTLRKELTVPTKSLYIVGEELDLTGGLVTYINYGKDDEVFPLTEDMLILPEGFNKDTADGEYTIKVQYEGVEIGEFTVAYSNVLVTDVELIDGREALPQVETFDVELTSLDLTNLSLKVSYSDGTDKTIPVTIEMLVDRKGWTRDEETELVLRLFEVVYQESFKTFKLEFGILVQEHVATVTEINDLADGTAIPYVEFIVAAQASTDYSFSASRVGHLVVTDGNATAGLRFYDSKNNATVAGKYKEVDDHIAVIDFAGNYVQVEIGSKLAVTNLQINKKTGTSNYVVPTANTTYYVGHLTDISALEFEPTNTRVLQSNEDLEDFAMNVVSSDSVGGILTGRDFHKVTKFVGTEENPLYAATSGSGVAFFYLVEGDDNTQVKKYMTPNGTAYTFSAEAETMEVSLPGLFEQIGETPNAFVGEIYVMYITRLKTDDAAFHYTALGCGCTLQAYTPVVVEG